MSTLTVATLNVWNKSGPWLERLPLIRDELSMLLPDVIGLQEVLRMSAPVTGDNQALLDADQAAQIADGLGYRIAYGAAMNFGNGLLFGNALLSRHPILEHDNVILPGAESGETRALLYALIETPHGELPAFVTHLNWKLHHGSVRLRQAVAIAEHIGDRCPIDDKRLPPVLMGDFNADPDSDEIRFLRGAATIEGKSVYFADAWGHAGQGRGYTFDRKNRFAALAHEPPRRIDYIFVRGPDRLFRGEPIATRLAFCTPKPGADGEIWPSDHFGVVTELMVEARTL
jgi:endonuclease/exonuclease/phosphatase family metal-dependent hydrolase